MRAHVLIISVYKGEQSDRTGLELTLILSLLERYHVQIQLHLGVPEDYEVRLQPVSVRTGESEPGTHSGDLSYSLIGAPPCWLQY